MSEMLACLRYELELRTHPPLPTDPAVGNYDPFRFCEHTPDDAYTRAPCSCGRELYPLRGRGKGEPLSSPRRIKAKLKAIEAEKLSIQGYTYATIARKLGYQTPSGVAKALQRLRDYRDAWRLYEERTGHRRYMSRAQVVQAYLDSQEADQEIEALQERLAHASREEQLAIADEYLKRRWMPGDDEYDDDDDEEEV